MGLPRPTAYDNLLEGVALLVDELDRWGSGVSGPTTPLGAVVDYAGAADPDGGSWLLCDGRAISRAGYASLFSVLGTSYGVGDGATTFNIPDFRGRTSVMVDGAAARLAGPDTRGASGGEEQNTLLDTQLPSHVHTMSHDHGLLQAPGSISAPPGPTAVANGAAIEAGGGGASNPIKMFNGNTGAVGSGSSHNNMQPYLVANKIIRVA